MAGHVVTAMDPEQITFLKGFDHFPVPLRYWYWRARKARREYEDATVRMRGAEERMNLNHTTTTKRLWAEAAAVQKLAKAKMEADQMVHRAVILDPAAEKDPDLFHLEFEAQQARRAEEQQRAKVEAISAGSTEWPGPSQLEDAQLEDTLEDAQSEDAQSEDAQSEDAQSEDAQSEDAELEDMFKEFDRHKEIQRANLDLQELMFEAEFAAKTYRDASHKCHPALEPNGAFSFLDLPAEVRSDIYKYAMTDLDGLKCDPVRNPTNQAAPFKFSGRYNRGLLQTCKQIRTEAISAALACNLLRFLTWDQAMLVLRHYGLPEAERAYSIRVRENLHAPEYYGVQPDADKGIAAGYDSEDDSLHEAQFEPMVEFCERYPHISVQLDICNICPWDILEPEEAHQYVNGWYDFLSDWWQRHPASSLKLTFAPNTEMWDRVACDSPDQNDEVRRKLHFFGKEAMRFWHSRWEDVGVSVGPSVEPSVDP